MKNTKLKKDVTCLTMNARERKRFKSLSGIKPQTLAFCPSMLYFWATSTENSRERIRLLAGSYVTNSTHC